MRKIIVAVLVGMFVGALLGALILGVSQYFNERWQSDWIEIERWVLIASFMSAQVGAISGALIGLIIGVVKAKRLP